MMKRWNWALLLGETETEENEIEYCFYFIHSFNMNNQYYIMHLICNYHKVNSYHEIISKFITREYNDDSIMFCRY